MPLCSLGKDLHSSSILGQGRDMMRNGVGNIAILCSSGKSLSPWAQCWKATTSAWRSSHWPNLGYFEQQNQWNNGLWLMKIRMHESILIEINWSFDEKQSYLHCLKMPPQAGKIFINYIGKTGDFLIVGSGTPTFFKCLPLCFTGQNVRRRTQHRFYLSAKYMHT